MERAPRTALVVTACGLGRLAALQSPLLVTGNVYRGHSSLVFFAMSVPPRAYARKTTTKLWCHENMAEAIRQVRSGSSFKTAATMNYVPEKMLRAFVKIPSEFVNENKFKKAFSPEQLKQLKKYLVEIDQKFFGLTILECRRLSYEFAIRVEVTNRFNESDRLAVEESMYDFFNDVKLNLRTRERFGKWDQEDVDSFFKLLYNLLKVHNFPPERIFHVDEICISSVPNDLTKQRFSASDVGGKGECRTTVVDARDNVTLVCCASASGYYIPPMIAFPRDRMIPGFLRGLPPGSIGYTSEKGLINTELFLTFLKHFVQHALPTKDAPVLLLLDNHISYISIEAMNLCKRSNVVLLGFPPYSRQKLQPLDISFFGPLKACYSRSCDGFSEAYPRIKLTVDNVGEVFRTAYCRTAIPDNATLGFITSGIQPFHPELHCSQELLLHIEQERAKEASADTAPYDSDVEIISWNEPSTDSLERTDVLAGFSLGHGERISCLRCTGLYPIKDWIQCFACRQWWHRNCGGFDKGVQCDSCKDSILAAGV